MKNTYLAFISVLLLFISCDEFCKSMYMADMICSKLAVLVPTVETGTAFAITTLVKNVAESTNACETSSASESNTKYNVKYRPNENSPWDDTQFNNGGNLVFDVYVPTLPLEPDQETGFEPQFNMQVTGQYRFEGNADGKGQVDERDEYNNGGGSQGQLNGKTDIPPNVVIVTVVADPNYIPIGKKPTVEYLGFKILY